MQRSFDLPHLERRASSPVPPTAKSHGLRVPVPAAHRVRVMKASTLETRGRRERRALAAPIARCAKMESTPAKSLQVSRTNPALPAQWVTTYAALSSASGLDSRRRPHIGLQA